MGTGGGTSGGTSYTVTFETNGGSAVDPQTVAAGETAKKPEDPKKASCNFGGWYADSELASAFSFATKIGKDTTLYAKWIDDSVPTYKVEIVLSEHCKSMTATPSAGVAEGTEVTLEIEPEKGYALDTLTVDGADKTADVAEGKCTFTMPGHDVTVSAAFKSIYSTGLVGDIVLSDGKYITAENYTKYKSIVDASDETAIAVIFDADKKLGVGLVQGASLAWAKSGTTGYNTTIATLVATETSGSNVGMGGNIGNADIAEFSGAGANDGSESLAKFKTAVGVSSGALSSTDYPAWAWIEDYAATANLTGTSYESGWYMPSIAELCKLYQAKTDVNKALSKIIGATQMSTRVYWSSNQYPSYVTWIYIAWYVGFGSGELYGNIKSNSNSVCAVRAFN